MMALISFLKHSSKVIRNFYLIFISVMLNAIISNTNICASLWSIILDSGEVQTEENKVSLDVNKKRTVKTQAQVMALENFYKGISSSLLILFNCSLLCLKRSFSFLCVPEHKFPSDEMKAQMAVQVGLTEKQISSWFCHRRLKDKRRDETYANGRQDRSILY